MKKITEIPVCEQKHSLRKLFDKFISQNGTGCLIPKDNKLINILLTPFVLFTEFKFTNITSPETLLHVFYISFLCNHGLVSSSTLENAFTKKGCCIMEKEDELKRRYIIVTFSIAKSCQLEKLMSR